MLLVRFFPYLKTDYYIHFKWIPYIFSDKYDTNGAITDLCGKHIGSSVHQENILDTFTGLCLINKGQYLMNEETFHFLKDNFATLMRDPKWHEFAKNNPGCVLKMLEISMSK